MFNRSFNVDMILFRNLITTVTSAWYLKPFDPVPPDGSQDGRRRRHRIRDPVSRPSTRRRVPENTPGLAKALGLEFNAGITYDTSDRLHAGWPTGCSCPSTGSGTRCLR